MNPLKLYCYALLMSLAAWMYTIATSLHRVRSIILERERHTRWVRQLIS